ncbi:MAG: cell division protein FtsQ/DivIB [Minisyncoccota bacterium]
MEIYSDKKKILKRRRAFRIKLYFLFLLLALLVFGFFYLITYSSLFKIKDVLIENNKFLTNDEVLISLKQKVLSSSFGGQAGFDNLLAWPSGEIKISDPAILNVNIKKEWFKRIIRVEVNERERFAIWCNSGANTCYWIDKEGFVFADAPVTEGSLVFTVFDKNDSNLFLGSRIEEDRFVGNLISILNNFYKTEFEVKRIVSDGALKELRVETLEGPTFIFSTRFDSSKNIALIKDLDLNKVEYIDLTVDNKIFYKNIKK